QRPVEKVRGRVIAHGIGTRGADFQIDTLAGPDRALNDLADVQDRVAETLRVLYAEAASGGADEAAVADLAALFGVEIGLLHQQRNLIAFAQLALGGDDVVAHPAEQLG